MSRGLLSVMGGSLLNSQEQSARLRVVILVLAVAALVVVADQLSKSWIITTIGRGKATHEIELLPGWLVFQYTENVGSAFGLFRVAWLSVTLAVVVIGVVIITVLRLGRLSQVGSGLGHLRLVVSLGLVLGGGVGNLIDRFMRGYVVDFILVPKVQITLSGTVYRWPNFNIADSAITVGVLLLLISMFLVSERKT